jgi:DNA-binding transcriptional LysR family regulator
MERLVKLNTNESPYGPSPKALAAINQQNTDDLRLYPDPEGAALKKAIADLHGLDPKQVFLGNGSDEVLEVHGRLACNNAAIAHLWARQGHGIAYLSELVVSESLSRGELVNVFPAHLGAPVPIYAVWPCNRFVHTRVSTLIEALVEMFAKRLAALSKPMPTNLISSSSPIPPDARPGSAQG